MACRSTVEKNQMLVCELLWQGNEPKKHHHLSCSKADSNDATHYPGKCLLDVQQGPWVGTKEEERQKQIISSEENLSSVKIRERDQYGPFIGTTSVYDLHKYISEDEEESTLSSS